MEKICIVLMTNNIEIYKVNTLRTIEELRTIGKYLDDIVLMYGDDLIEMQEIQEIQETQETLETHKIEFKNQLKSLGVELKYFPTIDRTRFIEMFKIKPFVLGDGREITKTFQFHKFYLFDKYFKQWDKIFYIDVGMHIFKPIDKIIGLDCKNKLLAHSDAYPYFKSKLNSQFETQSYPEVYSKLKSNFKLNVDFFQSTILLFDTNIINSNTFCELVDLSEEYFISKTNEQGILNLYFNSKLKIWKQIQVKDNTTYFYDFWERVARKKQDYIMLKRIRFG